MRYQIGDGIPSEKDPGLDWSWPRKLKQRLQATSGEAPAAPGPTAVTSFDFEKGRFRYTLDVLMIDGKHWRLRKYFEDFYDFQISLLESFSSYTEFIGEQQILLWTPRPMPNMTGRRRGTTEVPQKLRQAV